MSDKPTYEELEAMYFAQCDCTDEWEQKARKKSDPALKQRINELEQILAKANASITDLNIQLVHATRKQEETRKEAQPEVTGAVAWVHILDLGRTCEVSAHQECDEQIALYTADAIEAAVREKLKEVREVIALLEQSAEPFDSACMKLRALMESPPSKENEA